MEFKAEGPLAVPLWINGRPYLSMGERLFDVVNPLTGAVVRRVPLCGVAEVEVAVGAALDALPGWAAQPLSARHRLLIVLAEALQGYATHFAKLLQDESGISETEALAQIEAAVNCLQDGRVHAAGGGVLGGVIDRQRPLSGLATMLAPVALAGGALVCKPSPHAPGAVFAFCELTQRAGWPAGVVNLVQGDDGVLSALCHHADIAEIDYCGGAELAEPCRASALAAGKRFVDVTPRRP